HDSGHQDRGAERFGENAAPERRAHQAADAGSPASLVLPIASSAFCRVIWSSFPSGKLAKISMRLRNMRSASAKARRISASLPVAAAGSGTPQCAVIGCPGQNGQGSFAALSQTVNTKSSFGAPARENSSQLLERNLLTS